MIARIVIDVDCDAAESGDFGGELVEAGVVLSVGRKGLVCGAGKEEVEGVLFSFPGLGGHCGVGGGLGRGAQGWRVRGSLIGVWSWEETEWVVAGLRDSFVWCFLGFRGVVEVAD